MTCETGRDRLLGLLPSRDRRRKRAHGIGSQPVFVFTGIVAEQIEDQSRRFFGQRCLELQLLEGAITELVEVPQETQPKIRESRVLFQPPPDLLALGGCEQVAQRGIVADGSGQGEHRLNRAHAFHHAAAREEIEMERGSAELPALDESAQQGVALLHEGIVDDRH
jgi:hypothetical protein